MRPFLVLFRWLTVRWCATPTCWLTMCVNGVWIAGLMFKHFLDSLKRDGCCWLYLAASHRTPLAGSFQTHTSSWLLQGLWPAHSRSCPRYQSQSQVVLRGVKAISRMSRIFSMTRLSQLKRTKSPRKSKRARTPSFSAARRRLLARFRFRLEPQVGRGPSTSCSDCFFSIGSKSQQSRNLFWFWSLFELHAESKGREERKRWEKGDVQNLCQNYRWLLQKLRFPSMSTTLGGKCSWNDWARKEKNSPHTSGFRNGDMSMSSVW